MKKKKTSYIYTNKKHSEKGIFSTALAVMCFAMLIIMVLISYSNEGNTPVRFGVTAFICMLFSGAGVIIGFWGKNERDTFLLFSIMGIVWNVINLLCISGILYAGI